jgi:hypothetical protein
MLTSEERRWIYRHAYLPEHLPDYVCAVSGAEPYLLGSYLCFLRKQHLIFIGYPLDGAPADISRSYEAACDRFQPSTVAIVAPQIWLPAKTYEPGPTDHYYRLDLPIGPPKPAVTYMVRRAAGHVRITDGKFGREHRKLVDRFLAAHELTPEQTHIYKRLKQYQKKSESACLLEARFSRALIAFTIVDIGAAEFAFYMFSIRSPASVPGASDLLFRKMVDLAQAEGKKAINLGLGIHSGIRRFKQKWGGVPFLSHCSALVHQSPPDLGKLAAKL